ncbi:MAG: hypothetical protein FWG98_00210 [Candidatus Cloacimonetes bacterium]|nr:hypothetical protein [Candidatus Cloacimonadota bacterium]
MKKLLLIGLVFILISFGCAVNSVSEPLGFSIPREILDEWNDSTSRNPIVQTQIEALSINDARLRAQNDFRRKLLEFLSQEYQKILQEHFSLWQDSRQGFNRQLIEQLTSIADNSDYHVSEGNRYIHTISLSQSAYNNLLQRERENTRIRAEDIYQRAIENKDINNILSAIDMYLMYPEDFNETVNQYYENNTKIKLDYLVNELKNIKIDYPSRQIVYREQEIDILIKTNMGSILNFIYHDQRVEKIADRNNSISLKVGFNRNPSDIRIITQSGINDNFTIRFDLNTERTYRTNQLSHNLFLYSLINRYIQNTSGEINILYIAGTSFWIRSNNFSEGINRINEMVRLNNWEIGNEQNYINILDLNKVIIEERRLNIGSYYVKASLEINILDKDGNLLQNNRIIEAEAQDTTSYENSHRRIDRMLLNELNRLERLF